MSNTPRPDFECPFEKVFPSQLRRDNEFYMWLAYNQAIDAWLLDEVPIGAIIEFGGNVIAAAHNQRDSTRDPTAHAEMLALTQAAKAIGDWRLNEATLYVTKEPCPMCSGATLMARLKCVVFAVSDPKMGCLGGATDLNALPQSNHHLEIIRDVLTQPCRELLQTYFRLKRQED
ncbi:MAG: nucleoside deaminase [Opitutaceae bacterium]|nr:nucleoside deaminase [Opitutaceae bacterium]